MAKDPAFLFYAQDFIMGTMFMTDEETGIYIRLLCAQHQQGGIIKKKDFESKVNGNEIIKRKFIETEEGYINERLMKEMEKRAIKSTNLSTNAKERWNKIKTKKEQKQSKSNAKAQIGICRLKMKIKIILVVLLI